MIIAQPTSGIVPPWLAPDDGDYLPVEPIPALPIEPSPADKVGDTRTLGMVSPGLAPEMANAGTQLHTSGPTAVGTLLHNNTGANAPTLDERPTIAVLERQVQQIRPDGASN